jgi:hypothetical protein
LRRDARVPKRYLRSRALARWALPTAPKKRERQAGRGRYPAKVIVILGPKAKPTDFERAHSGRVRDHKTENEKERRVDEEDDVACGDGGDRGHDAGCSSSLR